MRIAFLLPDLAMGGAQRHTLDLARRLIARGHACRLAVFKHRVSADLAAQFADLDIQYLHGGRMTAPSHWLRTAKWVAAGRPEALVCVNQAPAILGAGLRRMTFARHRLVTIFHTTLLLESDRSRFPAFRAAVSLGDGLVFVSHNQMEYWVERGLKAPSTVAIRNGIDLQAYAPATPDVRELMRRRLDLAPDSFAVGLSATFRPEKNHSLLLRAIAALRAQGLPAVAVLIGDGATRAAVEAEADSLGVREHCRFLGEQPNVQPYLAACDVGVLCSTSVETLSLAALEMGAMGLPLVLSDIGGASEIVSLEGNGLLFPSGDLQAFAACLKAIHAEPKRFSARAREKIIADFDIERMVDDYERMIRSLVRSQPSR